MTTYDNIKNRRIELNLSQDELAKKLGYSDRSAISKIEAGNYDLSITKIKAIAKALNIPVYDLVEWEEPNKKDSTPISEREAYHTYVLNPTLASAGSSSYNDGYSEALEIEVPDALLGKYAGRKDLQFIKVTGESMNNVIKPDSIVAYTTEPSLTNLNGGDIVLYRYQSEQGIKRFYDIGDSVLFRPDSNMSDFQEQRFLKDEYLEIIGKVVIYSVFM